MCKEVGEGGSLNALIVSDGEIEKEAAKVVGWTPQKIKKTLRSQSTDLSDVFIMYGDSAGKFRIIKKAP